MHLLRPAIRNVESRSSLVESGHFLEESGLPLVHAEVGDRGEGILARLLHDFEHHQAGGIGIAQRLEKHGVHHAEYRGVGAYAQSQCGDHGKGKARAFYE
jgi:hypothetical protein